MIKHIIPFIFIFSLSCHAQQPSDKEDKVISEAKWYYYSYAAELKAYSNNGNEIEPLACNIKVNAITHINVDTTKYYFSLYDKDTLNICYLKPLSLIGISVVKNELYIPIYHAVIFDSDNDSTVYEKMKKQNLFLQNKIVENKEKINVWLKEEQGKRKAY